MKTLPFCVRLRRRADLETVWLEHLNLVGLVGGRVEEVRDVGRGPHGRRVRHRRLGRRCRLHHHEVRLEPHARDVPVVGAVPGVGANVHLSGNLIPRHVVIQVVRTVDADVGADGESIRSKCGDVIGGLHAGEREGGRRRHTALTLCTGSSPLLPRDEHDIGREVEACDRLRRAGSGVGANLHLVDARLPRDPLVRDEGRR